MSPFKIRLSLFTFGSYKQCTKEEKTMGFNI